MKKYIVGAILAMLIVIPFAGHAQSATQTLLDAWKVVSGYITPRNSANGLKVPSLGSSGNPCVSVSATGAFATTTCGGVASGTSITLNGQTGLTQTFATQTSGSLFNVTSSGNVHTFTFPST